MLQNGLRIQKTFGKFIKQKKLKILTSMVTLIVRMNYSSQNINSNFIVIYNSSGKDANAVVIERTNLELRIYC